MCERRQRTSIEQIFFRRAEIVGQRRAARLDFVDVPLATLLSRDYADTRRKLIGGNASLDFRPGDICGAPEACARRRLLPEIGAGDAQPNLITPGAKK